MNGSVMAWVQSIVSAHGAAGARVLEIGSYDVNGSVKPIFVTAGTATYVGVDVVAGPGVDVIAPAKSLPFDDASFDTIVSTEMLEHDATFWLSLAEMKRVLRPAGHLLLTARGNGFPYHGSGHFKDIYRFMPDSVPFIVQLAGCELVGFAQDPEGPGLFIHGRRNR